MAPYTSMTPLGFVLGISMIREAYEDFVRFCSIYFYLRKNQEMIK